MAKYFSQKVGTNPVRLSYCNLDKPRASAEGADPKYSCVLLIPKSDKGCLKKLRDAMTSVFNNNPGVFKGYKLSALDTIRDGAGTAPKGKAYPPEYADFWVLNASNKKRPVYEIKEDGAVRECMDPGEDIYSGCWARVGLTFFAYSNATTGIGCSLDLVRKVKDDESFSGSVSAKDYFADDDDDDSDDDL